MRAIHGFIVTLLIASLALLGTGECGNLKLNDALSRMGYALKKSDSYQADYSIYIDTKAIENGLFSFKYPDLYKYEGVDLGTNLKTLKIDTHDFYWVFVPFNKVVFKQPRQKSEVSNIKDFMSNFTKINNFSSPYMKTINGESYIILEGLILNNPDNKSDDEKGISYFNITKGVFSKIIIKSLKTEKETFSINFTNFKTKLNLANQDFVPSIPEDFRIMDMPAWE